MNFDFKVEIKRKNGFTLHVAEQCDADSVGIVGPSGSGKSTLLDAIAGMEKSTRIILGEKNYSHLPVAKRRMGYLTQDSLLFPHLSVLENLMYSPNAFDPENISESLGICHLLNRMPSNLSGGEKRRVALARAIMSRPEVLLLDEPFSGLDEPKRRDAMSLLNQVRSKFRLPIILVSHSADEVVGLTDWTICLENGRVVRRGRSEEILAKSETRIDNFFTANVIGPSLVECDGVQLHALIPDETSGKIRLACYAHDILLARSRPVDISARNVFESKIVARLKVGDLDLLTLDKPGLKVIVTEEASRSLSLNARESVFVIIKASSIAYLGPG